MDFCIKARTDDFLRACGASSTSQAKKKQVVKESAHSHSVSCGVSASDEDKVKRCRDDDEASSALVSDDGWEITVRCGTAGTAPSDEDEPAPSDADEPTSSAAGCGGTGTTAKEAES